MSSVDSEDGGGLWALETLGCFSPSVVISRDVRRCGNVEKLLYTITKYIELQETRKTSDAQ